MIKGNTISKVCSKPSVNSQVALIFSMSNTMQALCAPQIPKESRPGPCLCREFNPEEEGKAKAASLFSEA